MACSGDRYGKLVLVKFDKDRRRWLCNCDCGGTTYASITDMVNGRHLGCKCSLFGEKENKRLPNQQGLKNKLFARYKRGALQRNIEFQITIDEVIEITSKNCHYCGVEPQTVMKMGLQSYIHNGIDRIDNSIGYVKDNVVPCCSMCNYSKKENDLDTWKKWIERVYTNLHNEDR